MLQRTERDARPGGRQAFVLGTDRAGRSLVLASSKWFTDSSVLKLQPPRFGQFRHTEIEGRSRRTQVSAPLSRLMKEAERRKIPMLLAGTEDLYQYELFKEERHNQSGGSAYKHKAQA